MLVKKLNLLLECLPFDLYQLSCHHLLNCIFTRKILNMKAPALEQLKYPVGKFSTPAHYSDELIQKWIHIIKGFTAALEKEIKNLSSEQLNWIYRPEGWTIKQVVHHCADSHINSLIRFKWALTEEHPTIKPYYEHLWAELPDALENDVQHTMMLLKGLHYRWGVLLDSLDEHQLERTFLHPDGNKIYTLKETIASYAWHCEHHLAHVKQAIQYKGAF